MNRIPWDEYEAAILLQTPYSNFQNYSEYPHERNHPEQSEDDTF